jgi:DNA polymerase (family 10)
MRNFEVARLFDLMADLLELRSENPFRIRAYRRAARNLEALPEDVQALAREGRLDEVPGIGADLAAKITEYLRTGRMKDLDAARRDIPAGVVELMNIPGLGPKTARLLYDKQGIRSLARLEALARAGKLRGLPGIQAKTEQNILKGIALVRKGQARLPLGRALPLAEELLRELGGLPEAEQIDVAGSIRRGKDTIGDIDLVVASAKPARVMAAFAGLPQVAEVLERGETKTSIRHREGIQVDLRVVQPACFGAALQYFTGSKQHNIRVRELAGKKGLKLSEYGVFHESTGRRRAGATEAEVYAAVGLPWIPPELREDQGEVEAALRGALPRLVEPGDLRGDLHCHTKASDGAPTIEALARAAKARGYEYVAITDHTVSARVARGLTADEMAAHAARIRAVRRRVAGIAVLAGAECDIRPDGSLDYPDAVLTQLDLVVGAVHSRFKQPKGEMTRRICRALENPHVAVLAHPTGRLLGERDPYDVDLEQVLATAKRHDKAVEINAHPRRLDLCDVHARRAHDLGVPVAIDTDAHVLDELDAIRLGIATARRAWIGKAEVINAWPLPKLRAWLGRARGREGRAP